MSLRSFVVVVSSLALLVTLARCGPPAKVCAGCVVNGECVSESISNVSAAQCGTGGEACVVCPPAMACRAGVCVTIVTDAGEPDASSDAGSEPEDAGADASVEDAGLGDGGADAGPDDAGTSDAGTSDAGLVDGGMDAGSDGGSDAGPSGDGGVQRIRLMAANLTAGNNQNYDVPSGDVAPGPGIRIMQGARPDIVMLQEFRIGADNAAALQGMADLILGPGGYVCREPVAVGDIPNGVISRFPILSCGTWPDPGFTSTPNREFVYARIDVPGPTDLWVISVHLLTANSSVRQIEGAALVQRVTTELPPGDYVALGGDLNTDTADAGGEPIFATFAPVFVVQPQATDQFGNPGTNTNRNIRLADGGLDPQRNKPYDWVLANRALMARMVPVVISDGVTTLLQPTGFIIDTRVFDGGTIGVLAPALVGDSAAVNMQHMGVIRDFDLPL